MAQFRKDTHQYLNDGRTIFEVVMLADQYGNLVGPSNPTGMSVDAFGRARTSQPLTIFESFNRYVDDGSFVTSNTATATYSLNSNSASMELNVDTTTDAEVIRETTRVFAYQPGKSLQILTTFVMNEAKENLRQRVGYFSTQNGIFLEQDGTTINIVKRSFSNGSIVETKAEQSTWNIDPLDGTGPSLKTLDLSKAQIFFTDIEWLGVGTVRSGFVIDGSLIHCHSFHHANEVTDAYMTTACLPVRYEIKNTAETANNSTFKQICSTVISEGGYSPTGKKFSVGYSATQAKNLPTANTYYPVLSIKLKNARKDSIVLPRNVALVANGNNTRVNYRIVSGSNVTLTNSNFTSVSSDSAVEYDISANAVSGGRILTQGYVLSTTQSSTPVSLLDSIFTYQLERNTLANTEYIFVVEAAGATNGDDIIASLDWEEVT